MTTQNMAEPMHVGRPSVRGRRYMISAVHYLATMGGLQVLERGGNAIDAGVAAGVCINVVQPQLAMFGGVAPIIISLARDAGAAGPAQADDSPSNLASAASTADEVVTISG